MNCLVLFPHEMIDARTAEIRGDRAERLYREHGLRTGRRPPVSIFGGRLHEATVDDANLERIRLSVHEERPRPLRSELDLIVAFSRPQILKRILLNCTLLGLSRIHFVRTVNVEKSYMSSTALSPDRLLAELVYALEQACDSVPPEICFHRSLGAFFHERYPSIRELGEPLGMRNYFADTEGCKGFESCPPPGGGPVMLAVGPEAGWVPSERQLLIDSGFIPVSFGARVLRVDTAVLFGAAQVELLRNLKTSHS